MSYPNAVNYNSQFDHVTKISIFKPQRKLFSRQEINASFLISIYHVISTANIRLYHNKMADGTSRPSELL